MIGALRDNYKNIKERLIKNKGILSLLRTFEKNACIVYHLNLNFVFMFLLRMRGSRNFCQEGPGLAARKQPGQHFLSLAYFTVSEGVKWFYCRENYTFLRIQRGLNIFQEVGGPTFSSGGVQMLIPIESHITSDFPGGWGWSGSPIPLSMRT